MTANKAEMLAFQYSFYIEPSIGICPCRSRTNGRRLRGKHANGGDRVCVMLTSFIGMAGSLIVSWL
jgi:hypothetical protein